ncbi:MAG: hypothetical protein SF187_10105 [Deltaproteobacteria bacterium]|nr:hypothetical protein [Deltaproteobacteria bacterium]
MAAVKRAAVLWASAATLLLSLQARGDNQAFDAVDRAQVETLRADVASEIQLQAYDLLDELVFAWNEQPPFNADTPVVLADVSVPVGFGSGLQALIETHFASLIVKNPRSHVLLAHCPQCTAVVVRSGAKGTVISRGSQEPQTLAQAGASTGSRHALFLDFEVEGASLVLRARITRLDADLLIVHAKVLSTSSGTPALLRSEERLKSANEARQEYLDALRGRSVLAVPLHIGVRTYAPGGNTVGAPAFVWLSGGVEASLTQKRAWLGRFTVGATWSPELHVGWMAQARALRLLSGSESSLTSPDIYGFIGGSVISIYGKNAAIFQDDLPNLANLISAAQGNDPQAVFAAFAVGLEIRVKNRIGIGAFLETLPTMTNANAIGEYLDVGLFAFQSLGVEASLCF